MRSQLETSSLHVNLLKLLLLVLCSLKLSNTLSVDYSIFFSFLFKHFKDFTRLFDELT